MDWQALELTILLGIWTTAILLPFGVWLGRVLAWRDFPGKAVVEAAAALPLVLPPTVLGYYLLVVLGRESTLGRLYEAATGQPLVFTWQAAVVAALFHSAPLLVKISRAALESAGRDYERAARNLGASEWTIFLRVTAPLAWRSLLAALALCFARALGDFGITIMIAGNIPGRTQVVSVAIYDAVKAGNGELARVLVLVVSAVAMAVLYLANRLAPRRAF